MATIKDIIAYCKLEGRNKVVFSESYIDRLQYINVGHEITSSLTKESWESDINKGVLNQQLFDSFYYHDLIGRYLAIENIGVLFEEKLNLNLRNKFDQSSIGQVLIVQVKGEVGNWAFSFYGSEQFTINISVLSPIILLAN